MLTANRPFLLATAAAAVMTVGTLCLSARAADSMKDMPPTNMGMAGKPMMGQPMTVDEHAKAMVLTEMDQAKQMAGDPAQADAMAKDQAKMMVMDHLAQALAHDPAVRQAAMAAMTDPAMMRVHAQAMAMASDPAQMKKLQDEIMADPAAMKTVVHQAMTTAAMKDKTMDHAMGMGMGHDMGNGMAGEQK